MHFGSEKISFVNHNRIYTFHPRRFLGRVYLGVWNATAHYFLCNLLQHLNELDHFIILPFFSLKMDLKKVLETLNLVLLL